MVKALVRRSARLDTGRFLVEGPQAVRELVAYAAPQIVDLYVTVSGLERNADIAAAAAAAGCDVHEASEEVLAAMADADTPQGILAVAQWHEHTLDAVLAGRPRLLVLLSQVRDPGNAGTVIRAADAAGADAVLLTDHSVDALSPKVVRSTAGSLFHLPVVTGVDAVTSLARVRAAGLRVYAADGGATRATTDVDLETPHAWVLGNEAWGLTEDVLGACDERVRIPIYGKAESLNLAMAATVCLYASAGAQRPGHRY